MNTLLRILAFALISGCASFDGDPNGLGTHTFPLGDAKYIGMFKNGMPNGQGAFIWPSGEKFETKFKNWDFDGPGIHTLANGDKWEGWFKYSWTGIGSFNWNGEGTYTFTDGRVQIGEWKDKKPHGRLIEYRADKSISRAGIWEYGKFIREESINPAIFTRISPVQPVQQITAPNIGNEKIRTEAEEAKKKQAELEIKLRVAQQERLLAEAEEAKRKQAELEEQMRLAQQPTQPNQLAVSSGAERRVALVIGNATYKFNPLKNSVNDSTDMARSLRTVGFDVIEANNTTLSQMREATRKFADKLGSSDVGLVYFSGHGIEVKGRNYLIPVNADIKREYEVVDQAFDASQFLEMMDNIRGPNNKRVNILIIDACRNNELQRSWRSTNNGLARMDAPGGTFISFATAPGKVAADGEGRNSPYTKHLLQALKQPNIPIEQVFKVVRRNVMDETKGEQIPWENSSLVGDFYFTVRR
jgi:hypothetical protein